MSIKKKILAIILFSLLFILSLSLVQPAETVQINGLINDYANIITPEQKLKIETILAKLYDDKIAEFSIVTINSLEGADIESYAINLAQGRLGDKEKDNGLLLLIAAQDRRYRFEVGRGLEPILNDARIGRIGRDYLVENFRNNDYGKGIYEAAVSVDGALRGKAEPEITNAASDAELILTLLFIFIIIFFSIILPIILLAKGHRERKDKDKFFDAALIAALLFSNKGRGRGGLGGGFGGGFGGFGGGGFGGGGASGRW